jgi:ubiquinone/menaquinone biosynthesis C-methylase UbiE
MKNTILNNQKYWDQDYLWTKDGDEWDSQAQYCGTPYETWKRSLIESLIYPNIGENSTVLEIAPGYERWSESLIERAPTVILVDVSPSCIDFCRNRFRNHENVIYHVNNGLDLKMIATGSINFLWSYVSFVHMDRQVISSYIKEISRILKPGARAIIHHPGRSSVFLFLGFLRHWNKWLRDFYRTASMRRFTDHDGWRSNISGFTIRHLARKNRLNVFDLFQFWDVERKIGVPRFNDGITIPGK